MSNRPNVLLVTTDHWFASLLGAAGHPAIQTPTLDELCRNGIRFTRAYSECPVCIPARRTLMTGTTPRTHGDRTFQTGLPMPDAPTLARCFRDAGYQACAVGKLHVYPQRDRIGFDDVILDEEGRTQWGVTDDYSLYLGDRGHAGEQYAHAMSNNQYVSRPWHLDESLHRTNWAAAQMERTIRRRDPRRPGFWYLAFAHPHPPLTPLPGYLDLYRSVAIDEPYVGAWAAGSPDSLPYALRRNREYAVHLNEDVRRDARRAFYALCTHIDHQLRRVIGTLREEGILSNTIIAFTSDHGDMLGNHGLWAKRCFLENSARVPMLLCGTEAESTGDRSQVPVGVADARLVGLADVMPTLLGLCGIPIPEGVDGRPMVGSARREYLYGEQDEGATASRMVTDDRYKLIYFAAGNRFLLFDLEADPNELEDLSTSPDHARIRKDLTDRLIAELYGGDRRWLAGDNGQQLVGLPEPEHGGAPSQGLFGQRGTHWPPPPASGISVGA
ncbi:MAG: DUF4976 domain-containing protein [Spirochaetaceae bacterium]|nr:MAG: DUF4976 domain-containing protein [Spirochaetaceae bacterium]